MSDKSINPPANCAECGAAVVLFSNAYTCSKCPWPDTDTVPFGGGYGAPRPAPGPMAKTPTELRAMAKPVTIGSAKFSDFFPDPDQFAKAGREYQILTAREKQDIRVERLLEMLKLKVPALLILNEMRIITRGVLEERGLGDIDLPQFSDVNFKEEP